MPKRPDVLLEEFDWDAERASRTGTEEAYRQALRTGAGALRTARRMDREWGTHHSLDTLFRQKLEVVRQTVRRLAGR